METLPVEETQTSEYNMEEDEEINVPSLTTYEEIESSRAHVYNDFDNEK